MAKQNEAALNYMWESVRKFVDIVLSRIKRASHSHAKTGSSEDNDAKG